MNRKIYEFRLPQNATAIFYLKEGEIINVSDPQRPEPIENYGAWDPENEFTFSRNGSHKLTTPLTRVKNENIKAFFKMSLKNVREYADSVKIEGNLFTVIKQFEKESLCAVFVYDAFGGKLIE